MDIAALDLEIDVVDGNESLEFLGQVFGFKNNIAHGCIACVGVMQSTGKNRTVGSRITLTRSFQFEYHESC
jgi:hypothetical protein